MSLVDLQKSQLLDPVYWMSYAEDLFASAALFDGILKEYWDPKSTKKKESEKYIKVHLMLLGFALENTLKALIVQDQRHTIEAEFNTKGKLPQILRSHDLIRLAERARLSMSDDGTKEILERLTRHSVWAGRYPVPLLPSNLPAEDAFGLASADLVPMSTYYSSDWKNSLLLFQNAKHIMEKRKMSQQGVAPYVAQGAPSGER